MRRPRTAVAALGLSAAALVGLVLHEGYSDEQIYDFMVARYGEFVLYRPKASGITLYLWLAPVVLLILAIAVVVLVVKRSRQQRDVMSYNDEQREQLQRVLDSVDQDKGDA